MNCQKEPNLNGSNIQYLLVLERINTFPFGPRWCKVKTFFSKLNKQKYIKCCTKIWDKKYNAKLYDYKLFLRIE